MLSFKIIFKKIVIDLNKNHKKSTKINHLFYLGILNILQNFSKTLKVEPTKKPRNII